LIFATGATLFLVPTVFKIIRRPTPSRLKIAEVARS
jgi:hypothetical protein